MLDGERFVHGYALRAALGELHTLIGIYQKPRDEETLEELVKTTVKLKALIKGVERYLLDEEQND